MTIYSNNSNIQLDSIATVLGVGLMVILTGVESSYSNMTLCIIYALRYSVSPVSMHYIKTTKFNHQEMTPNSPELFPTEKPQCAVKSTRREE